jgi:hypothetical protein
MLKRNLTLLFLTYYLVIDIKHFKLLYKPARLLRAIIKQFESPKKGLGNDDYNVFHQADLVTQ